MNQSSPDDRSATRRSRDERIAAEPRPQVPNVSQDAGFAPVEAHLAALAARGGRGRQSVAMEGVVENGVVRPLDPNVKLPEHARVIIVASEQK